MSQTITTAARPRYVTLTEAALTLSVSERTIRRLIAKGDLRAWRVGGQLRIPAAELDAPGEPVGGGHAA